MVSIASSDDLTAGRPSTLDRYPAAEELIDIGEHPPSNKRGGHYKGRVDHIIADRRADNERSPRNQNGTVDIDNGMIVGEYPTIGHCPTVRVRAHSRLFSLTLM